MINPLSTDKRRQRKSAVSGALANFDLANHLPFLFKHIHSQLEVASGSKLASFGISVGVLRILAVLWQYGELTHTELAQLASVEISTLSRVSDAIQRKGLVSRKRDSKDQRMKRVMLTAKGRKVAEETIPAVVNIQNHMFARMSTRDKNRLTALLHKVVLTLNQYSDLALDVSVDTDALFPRTKRAKTRRSSASSA